METLIVIAWAFATASIVARVSAVVARRVLLWHDRRGGPTTFVKRPWVQHVDELGDGLHRLTLRATVARGAEWLAEVHFGDVLREGAPDGLVVHGPISFAADEGAARTFARATAGTRWARA